MKKVKEKVAYLKGLMDGADFLVKGGKERAIWAQLLEVLDEVGEALEAHETSHTELEGYVEAIDEDLGQLEDDVYEDEDEDEEEFVEMECPHCKESVRFEESLLYEDNVEVTCPNCGEVIYASDDDEESGDDEEGGCGCDDSGCGCSEKKDK